MAASDGNPNSQDLPDSQQVMSSPSTEAAQGGRVAGRTVMSNGVPPPLRGTLDMDGEVRQSLSAAAGHSDPVGLDGGDANGTNLGYGAAVVGPGRAQGRASNPTLVQGPAASAAPESAAPSTGVVFTEVRQQARVQGPDSGGMISGVLRSLQALPATMENLVARSASGGQDRDTGGVHDSVEYASVKSSADGQRGSPPSATQVPLTPLVFPGEADTRLLDNATLRRMQQMEQRAPLIYPAVSPEPPPVRPPSTSSSDVQAEVRRQLMELMADRDEETRRLRAQVESLVSENLSLRLRTDPHVQQGMHSSGPGGSNPTGLGGLGWLGRGLGTLMSQVRPSRPAEPPKSEPPPPPHGVQSSAPIAASGGTPCQMSVLDAGQVQSQVYRHPVQGSSGLVDRAGVVALQPCPAPPQSGETSTQPGVMLGNPEPLGNPAAVMNIPQQCPVPQPMLPSAPALSQSTVPAPGIQGQGSVWGLGPRDPVGLGLDPASGLPPGVTQPQVPVDPMNVVLTGMAQLQSVVSELTSPKSKDKPEVIKPGVGALPALPAHGPESCLAFADWLHETRPALADVSDTSEELWALTVAEATQWYSSYLRLDPLSRLTAKPVPSSELNQPRWARVSRRIETMVLTAAPAVVKEEVSASRTSGLLAVLCKLFVIYGPGSLTEREIGLRHIQEPPAGTSVQDTIEVLRRWKRWCSRMVELGGVLPDCALQVRALTKVTRSVLSSHPEVAFRVNLARAALQIDLTPDDDKVSKFYAQLLSELEAISYRGIEIRISLPEM